MDGQTVGFIGGAFGAVIGIIGGIVGTYFSIKNTNSQAEKNFMIRVSIFVWIAIIIFLALLLLLPKPYNFFMWGIYGVLFSVSVHYINKKINTIRESEKMYTDV
ncbi:MAG: hypothetical protein DBP01_03100 [gamma proteobacterium symbiont of Ctena orbiculata]|nr:MAG: hypothetical protein DBP01_03100 [gamma proteobacterium symbiont of Ctena orbiculata]